MKNDGKILDQILEKVNDIGARIEVLESRPAPMPIPYQQHCPGGMPNVFSDAWLRETYPDGYITVDEMEARKPEIYGPNGCHQLLAGMVIGDAPEGAHVIHPIVPMMFHDGTLGYAESMRDDKVVFSEVRDDLPVILGSAAEPKGIYVPHTASMRGIQIAQEYLDEMAVELEEKDEYYATPLTSDHKPSMPPIGGCIVIKRR